MPFARVILRFLRFSGSQGSPKNLGKQRAQDMESFAKCGNQRSVRKARCFFAVSRSMLCKTTRSRIGKWGLDSSVENLYQFFLFTISQGMFRVTCKYEGDGVEERVGGNRHVKYEYHWV